MKFQITILGANAAVPAYGRYMTAQLLNFNEKLFLIDCAEGTQIRLQQLKIKSAKVNYIFISHLHGDHIFGLPGLILSMSLNKRTDPLYIYSPPGLKKIIDVFLEVSESHLNYEIIYKETNPDISELIFEDDYLTVSTIPLVHRIPVQGFLFKEKKHPRKIIKEKIAEYEIPIFDLAALKEGKDWQSPDGLIIKNELLTKAPPEQRSYAFCTDTEFNPVICNMIENVNLLYHEATFDTSFSELAKLTGHSTAAAAAEIALKSKAKKLLIGHFSSRYSDLNVLLNEARTVFENSYLALDGTMYSITL
jgi:ribonuclease Z